MKLRKRSPEGKAWTMGAVMAIALSRRWELSPKQALRQLGLTRAEAVRAGVDPYWLEMLNGQWPRKKKETR